MPGGEGWDVEKPAIQFQNGLLPFAGMNILLYIALLVSKGIDFTIGHIFSRELKQMEVNARKAMAGTPCRPWLRTPRWVAFLLGFSESAPKG